MRRVSGSPAVTAAIEPAEVSLGEAASLTITAAAVSYTHLDVYKRQGQSSAPACGAPAEDTAMACR